MTGKIGKVDLEMVTGLGVHTRKKVTDTGTRHITRVSFDVETSPSNIARLLYFSKQDPTVNVSFEFPEAKFDFALSPVDLVTGEIVPDEISKLM
jgi:hypothetical protein